MPVLQMQDALWMGRFVDTEIVKVQLLCQISRDVMPPHQAAGPDDENHSFLHALCTGSPAAKQRLPIYHLLAPAADVQGIKPPCVGITPGETLRTELAASALPTHHLFD